MYKKAKTGTAYTLQPGQVEIDSTLRKSSGQVNLQISFYSAQLQMAGKLFYVI